MKWIKASERLPEVTIGYAKQIVLRWQFVDNVQLRVSTANQLVDIFKATVSDLTKIEWLDESLSTPSPNTSLLDALKELVELKDMKDKYESLPVHVRGRESKMLIDYQTRKPLAWEAARKLIEESKK